MASTTDSIEVTREKSWLVARFSRPQRAVSWAVVGGGFCETNAVAWLGVRNAELPADVDPRALLRKRMLAHGLTDAVGLLTSRRLGAFVDMACMVDGVRARCVATVGLGNALRAGDAPVSIRPVGTINVLCHVSEPLSDEAMLEALALASEAKALAVREAAVPSVATGGFASGTGTDCIVIASPLPSHDRTSQSYAGKHTNLGFLIGRTVHGAVAHGCADWKDEQR